VRGENAGDAFDHHIAHIGGRFADQRDAADRLARKVRFAQREAAHPFRASSRLASPASAHDEPDRPCAVIADGRGGPLIASGVERPGREQCFKFAR
jgi:hypothetical protein